MAHISGLIMAFRKSDAAGTGVNDNDTPCSCSTIMSLE